MLLLISSPKLPLVHPLNSSDSPPNTSPHELTSSGSFDRCMESPVICTSGTPLKQLYLAIQCKIHCHRPRTGLRHKLHPGHSVDWKKISNSDKFWSGILAFCSSLFQHTCNVPPPQGIYIYLNRKTDVQVHSSAHKRFHLLKWMRKVHAGECLHICVHQLSKSEMLAIYARNFGIPGVPVVSYFGRPPWKSQSS